MNADRPVLDSSYPDGDGYWNVRSIDMSEKHVHESDKYRHETEERMRIDNAGHVSPKPWPTQFDNDPSKWYEQTGKLPKREWVGLTDEERKAFSYFVNWEMLDQIEAKLKEKNT